jgi:integrase
MRSTPKRDKLAELIEGITDPLLATAATDLSGTTKDPRVKHGLGELADLTEGVLASRSESAGTRRPRPGTVRLSWLLEHRNVADIYSAAIASGRRPNSVRRSVHRAVADLLARHYGKVRRDEVLAEVNAPGAGDERKVKVTGAEIRSVLAECDIEFVDLPALAMLLAVDRGPLLRISPRAFSEEAGTLDVLDTKTEVRGRTIELSEPAWEILRRRCAGLGPDERIFTYSPDQVRGRWDAARDRAAGRPPRNLRQPRGRNRDKPPMPDPVGEAAERLLAEQEIVTLPILRFKDLRHLLPTAWNALGLPQKDLAEILGHAAGSTQTNRYITARVAGERERMDRVAEFLGLDRLHLRASGD